MSIIKRIWLKTDFQLKSHTFFCILAILPLLPCGRSGGFPLGWPWAGSLSYGSLSFYLYNAHQSAVPSSEALGGQNNKTPLRHVELGVRQRINNSRNGRWRSPWSWLIRLPGWARNNDLEFQGAVSFGFRCWANSETGSWFLMPFSSNLALFSQKELHKSSLHYQTFLGTVWPKEEHNEWMIFEWRNTESKAVLSLPCLSHLNLCFNWRGSSCALRGQVLNLEDTCDTALVTLFIHCTTHPVNPPHHQLVRNHFMATASNDFPVCPLPSHPMVTLLFNPPYLFPGAPWTDSGNCIAEL